MQLEVSHPWSISCNISPEFNGVLNCMVSMEHSSQNVVGQFALTSCCLCWPCFVMRSFGFIFIWRNLRLAEEVQKAVMTRAAHGVDVTGSRWGRVVYSLYALLYLVLIRPHRKCSHPISLPCSRNAFTWVQSAVTSFS